jgi:hypothetical protein
LDDYVFGSAFGNHLGQRPDMWPEVSALRTALQKNPDTIIFKAGMVFEEERSTGVLNNLPKESDYDDTGFLPRSKLEADLKKKILGRHPRHHGFGSRREWQVRTDASNCMAASLQSRSQFRCDNMGLC